MSKVTIFNNGNCALPVNGILLAIGAQVMVDPADVTPGLKQFLLEAPQTNEATETETVLSLVDEIQALSITKATERFSELDNDQLDELQALELSQNNPRSGFTDAITIELLNRSNTMDTDKVAADSESNASDTPEGGDDE